MTILLLIPLSSSKLTANSSFPVPLSALQNEQPTVYIGQADTQQNYVGSNTQPCPINEPPLYANLSSSACLFNPQDIAFDSSGNLWVADSGHERVLEFKAPLSTSMNASVVLGQQTFSGGFTPINYTVSQCPPTQTSVCKPISVAVDSSGDVWVGSYGRILEFKPPFSNGMSASLVIGEMNYTSYNQCMLSYGNTTVPNSVCEPSSIKFDGSGNLWVADSSNNDRVLEFRPPFSNGMNPSLVIGEANFTTDACLSDSNHGAVSASCFGAGSPNGLAFDPSGNLWVSDTANNRVLEFASPLSNGMAATLVIGQPDFTSTIQSNQFPSSGGEICVPSQTELCSPSSLAFDSSGNLWFSDVRANRILSYSPPFTNNMSPTAVIGQSNFTTYTGCQDSGIQSCLNFPLGLTFDPNGNLWVADSRNSRVLGYAVLAFPAWISKVTYAEYRFSTNQTGSGTVGGLAVTPYAVSGTIKISVDSVNGAYSNVTLDTQVTCVPASTCGFSNTTSTFAESDTVYYGQLYGISSPSLLNPVYLYVPPEFVGSILEGTFLNVTRMILLVDPNLQGITFSTVLNYGHASIGSSSFPSESVSLSAKADVSPTSAGNTAHGSGSGVLTYNLGSGLLVEIEGYYDINENSNSQGSGKMNDSEIMQLTGTNIPGSDFISNLTTFTSTSAKFSGTVSSISSSSTTSSISSVSTSSTTTSSSKSNSSAISLTTADIVLPTLLMLFSGFAFRILRRKGTK